MAKKVDQTDVRLCRTIELHNYRNVKPGFEFVPDLWTKTIATYKADSVLLVVFFMGLSQEVPAQFTNILTELNINNVEQPSQTQTRKTNIIPKLLRAHLHDTIVV